jgi:hypothetical protein
LPWSREQIEWAKEVGDVLQAEVDDSKLLRKGQADV